MVRNTGKKLRFEDLYEQLLGSLRDGSLAVGQKIPAERELAQQAGISYMTARQAVQALVDKGYLVRKPRVGTFVPFDIEKRLKQPAVNVIMPDTPPGAVTMQFERVVKQRLKAAGLHANLVKINSDNMDVAIRLLGDSSRPCILLMSPLVKEQQFRQAMLANSKIVLVGYDLSGIGIESVLCDDAMAARMAYSVLQQAGHDKIALAISDMSNPISQQVLFGWKSCMAGIDGNEAESLLIDLGNIDPRKAIERYLTDSLRKGGLGYSAIITACGDIGIGFCEALESVGLAVPQDISIVTLGPEECLPHFTPKLTCIDPHLDMQVQYAIDACQQIYKGNKPESLHLVTPEIFEGESIKILKEE